MLSFACEQLFSPQITLISHRFHTGRDRPICSHVDEQYRRRLGGSTDLSTGKVYYNTVTKAVSWEWPEDIPKPGGGADGGGENKDGWVAARELGQVLLHNHAPVKRLDSSRGFHA